MKPVLSQAAWRTMVDALPEGVVLCDATSPGQPVLYANPAFEKLTGFSLDELQQRGLGVLHSEQAGQTGLRRLQDAVASGMATRTLLQNHRRNGELFWMDVQIVPVHDDDGRLTHWVSLHREADARGAPDERTTGRFRAMAPELLQRQDPLTGFRIREAFEELLEHQLAVSQRERQSLAVFLLEIDDFERYTETFDRAAGDALLRRLAVAAAGGFRRRSDLLARVGDYRLAALSHSMDEPKAVAHAEALIRRVRALAMHHPRAAASRFVTLSVGVTSGVPGGDSSAAAVLEALDAALQEARVEGGNCCRARPLRGG